MRPGRIPTDDEIAEMDRQCVMRFVSCDVCKPDSASCENCSFWFSFGMFLMDVKHLKKRYDAMTKETRRLRQRLLTAAGDDLCRLSQDEIKNMSLGVVKIPPEDEFIASCRRFHAQVAGEAGVMENCLTLAQLVAENERLRADLAALKPKTPGETDAIKDNAADQEGT